MLLFCPTCANMLILEKGQHGYQYSCDICSYVYKITGKLTEKHHPKPKQVDDILGGAAAWENVDSTDATCPTCGHRRAYFMQIQIRSADEPMTTFYKCCNAECGHRFSEN